MACAYAVCVGAVALGEDLDEPLGSPRCPPEAGRPPHRRGREVHHPRAVPAVEALDAILGDGPARDARHSAGSRRGAYLWVKLFDVLASEKFSA